MKIKAAFKEYLNQKESGMYPIVMPPGTTGHHGLHVDDNGWISEETPQRPFPMNINDIYSSDWYVLVFDVNDPGFATESQKPCSVIKEVR